MNHLAFAEARLLFKQRRNEDDNPCILKSLHVALISVIPSSSRTAIFFQLTIFTKGKFSFKPFCLAFPKTVIVISQVKDPGQSTAMYVLIILTFRNWGNGCWVIPWIEWTHC